MMLVTRPGLVKADVLVEKKTSHMVELESIGLQAARAKTLTSSVRGQAKAYNRQQQAISTGAN